MSKSASISSEPNSGQQPKAASASIEDGDQQKSSPGASVHKFVHNHQFISGVLFSLLSLGLMFGVLALIATQPHTNIVHSESRQFQAKAQDYGQFSDMRSFVESGVDQTPSALESFLRYHSPYYRRV